MIVDVMHSPSLPVVLVLTEALLNATLRSSPRVSRAVLAGAALTTVGAGVAAENWGELPAAVDLTAYRIVQEALTNAVKHAAGSSAKVTVRRDGDVVIVEVTNDLSVPPAPRRAPGW